MGTPVEVQPVYAPPVAVTVAPQPGYPQQVPPGMGYPQPAPIQAMPPAMPPAMPMGAPANNPGKVVYVTNILVLLVALLKTCWISLDLLIQSVLLQLSSWCLCV